MGGVRDRDDISCVPCDDPCGEGGGWGDWVDGWGDWEGQKSREGWCWSQVSNVDEGDWVGGVPTNDVMCSVLCVEIALVACRDR